MPAPSKALFTAALRRHPWLTALLGAALAWAALWTLRAPLPPAPPTLSGYGAGTYEQAAAPGEARIRLDDGQVVTAVTYAESRPRPGQRVVVQEIGGQHVLEGPLRWPLLLVLLALLIAATLSVTGLQGFRALLGSGLCLAALWLVLLPRLTGGAGTLTLLPSLGLVLALSVYFVHGLNRKSHAALAALLLCAAAGFGLLTLLVGAGHLTGLSDRGATVAQASYGVDAVSLYVVGVMLTALGAMNDVAITQTSAVAALARTGHARSRRDLFRQGMQIGADHASGMVNVLVLVYAAGALPLLLLLRANRTTPLWVQMSGEGLFTELTALLLALLCMVLVVPVSTALAARWMFRESPPTAPAPD
ncbi:YibE/F family protein [Deinococcus indicus]|uniref:YibE/F family protein n=1 Tax=Deinococcus indicus TaxID=223556 RepID=UPI001FD2679E|nr:YibE/F family protein [Deinococcus indicus]